MVPVLALIMLISIALLHSNSYSQQWTVTLNIYPSAITFLPGDPDLEPVTGASTPVRVQITTWPPNRHWELTIRAEGNLVNAEGEVIPISAISWRATPGPPFVDGVLAAGQNLVLGRGRGDQDCEISFYLQNSWDYSSGEYSQVITFVASLI